MSFWLAVNAVFTLTEREQENSNNQNSASTGNKSHTNDKDRHVEPEHNSVKSEKNLKERKSFSVELEESTFDIPIFTEEFLNYNRSKSDLKVLIM